MVKNYLKLFEKCVDTVGKNSDNHPIETEHRKPVMQTLKDIALATFACIIVPIGLIYICSFKSIFDIFNLFF